MKCLKLAVLVLVALTATRRLARGALLPNEGNGYQYDLARRPAGRPVYGPPPGSFPQQSNAGLSGTYGAPGPAGFNQGFQGSAGPGGFQANSGQAFQTDAASQGFGGGNAAGRSQPYSFEYEVKDAASGNDYRQQESGDEYGSVRGEYRVLLPDTRTQIVRYTADDANGYLADVQYEGEAQFPRPGAAGFAAPTSFQQGRGVAGGSSGFGAGQPAADGFGGYAGSNQYLPPSSGSYGK